MNFRFEVEDVFTISGRGTVVTGKVVAGTINVGEEVEIYHNGSFCANSCVTGIEQFRKTMNTANAGDNCGILLSGVSKNDVFRGCVLTSPGGYVGHLTENVNQQTGVIGTYNPIDVSTLDTTGKKTSFTLNGGEDDTKKKWWQKLF